MADRQRYWAAVNIEIDCIIEYFVSEMQGSIASGNSRGVLRVFDECVIEESDKPLVVNAVRSRLRDTIVKAGYKHFHVNAKRKYHAVHDQYYYVISFDLAPTFKTSVLQFFS